MPHLATLRRTVLLLAAAVLLTVTGAASAFDIGAMTDAERTAFRAEIRAYLLENPEMLVEAMDALEARQAALQASADITLVQTNATDLFDDGISWVGGNPDGDVTLVEFMDYKCSYCKKSHAEVAELVKSDGNIRFILKEFPILGEQSLLAARFAIAVRQVGGADAYKQSFDTLMTLRGDLTRETLDRLATDLGLDAAAVRLAMESPEVAAEINANHDLASRLDISGTPTFVLGGQMLRGYVPLETMQKIVADARG